MKNSYEIKEVSLDFTDEDWKKYYDFREESTKIGDSSFTSWEVLKEKNSKSISAGIGIYMLWKNDKPNGHFVLESCLKDSFDKRFVDFIYNIKTLVLEEDLIQLIFNEFLKYDTKANFLKITSHNGINDFIEDKYSATIGDNLDYFELEIKEAKTDLIKHWLEISEVKFKDYKLRFFQDIPDELIQEYAHLFTQLLKDMPHNPNAQEFNVTAEHLKERQVIGKKNNQYSYRYLIFNDKDEIIGMTNVHIDEKDLTTFRQYMTGVSKEYRRKGFSKWTKSAMFFKLIEDFPTLKRLTTETHPDNIGSREMSQKMGYKKTETHKEFMICRKNTILF